MSTTMPIKDRKKLLMFRNYYKEVHYNPRNYALIVLGLNSALRISDILSLRWKDVYLNPISGYRSHLSVTEMKTGKENVLALNTASQEALEFYRMSLDSFDNNAFIFKSQKAPDSRISRSQAFRIVKKAAAFCGLDSGVSCHSLRKTFGYHAW